MKLFLGVQFGFWRENSNISLFFSMKIQLSLIWIMKFSYAYIVILRPQLIMQIWTISFKMICLRQVLLFFTLLVSIQALDKCPENVQTVDALNVEEVRKSQIGSKNSISRKNNKIVPKIMNKFYVPRVAIFAA